MCIRDSAHVGEVGAMCKSSLNAIRCISRMSWGAHLNDVLLANNGLARVYDRRSTFTRPTCIRVLEIARDYNVQAPMIQAYVSILLAASQTKLLAGCYQ